MKRFVQLFFYHSYNIVLFLFLSFFICYSLFLYKKSIYYTYIMIFLWGLLLGYILADKAHRYLKNYHKSSR